jgi:hypothetical protein
LKNYASPQTYYFHEIIELPARPCKLSTASLSCVALCALVWWVPFHLQLCPQILEQLLARLAPAAVRWQPQDKRVDMKRGER